MPLPTTRPNSPRDEDIAALGHSPPEHRRLRRRHDSSGRVIIEREDSDRGLADRERRRRHDGRQKTLEPIFRVGQFGRYARRAGVNLGADMVGDEADDALAVGGREALSRIGQSGRQSVDPEPAVGVQHYFDDCRVFEKDGDRGAERGAQHARAS